jgi:hypothetical protein
LRPDVGESAGQIRGPESRALFDGKIKIEIGLSPPPPQLKNVSVKSHSGMMQKSHANLAD